MNETMYYPTLGDKDAEVSELCVGDDVVRDDDGPELELSPAELAHMDSIALDG